MSGAKVHACSSVRHRPCHVIRVCAGSCGSTNTLDSRPGSTRMSWRVGPSGIGTAKTGNVLPWYAAVCAAAGQTGAPGVVDWPGCCRDVVTMYNSGSR